jgi:hypothetical protein
VWLGGSEWVWLGGSEWVEISFEEVERMWLVMWGGSGRRTGDRSMLVPYSVLVYLYEALSYYCRRP